MRVFRLGERVVDLAASTVTHRDEVQHLTVIETKLLGQLARRSGEVMARDELLVSVWGYRPGVQSRTIDTTTIRLRKKLEDDPSEPKHLIAVYGQGMRLDGVVSDNPSPGSEGFVGRTAELARIGEVFRGGARIVTLTGPAGAGKSRTAAEAMRRSSFDPIEVACGAVQSSTDLDRAVRAALGMSASRGPIGEILARDLHTVLLLDECELCIEAVARRVTEWLTAAPHLKILATSRAPLGLPQEQIIALGALEPVDAAALFLARVQRSSLRLPDEAVIHRVVGLLEGLPLAIELLAARCAVVPLEVIEPLLGAQLEVLGAPGRRSMAEVLERSFLALPPELRYVLTEIAAFESSFDLDDLAAVTEVRPAVALDRLEALASRSLLRIEPGGRYSLYTIVRQRARQDLTEDAPVRWRLVRWLARLGEPELIVSQGRELSQRSVWRHALPDLRVAIALSLSTDPAMAERCGLAAVWHLSLLGADEGLVLGETIASIAQTPRIRLFLALAMALLQQARDHLAQSIAALEAAVDLASLPRDIVAVRCTLASHRRAQGDRDGMLRELDLARPYVPLAGEMEVLWLQVMGYNTPGSPGQDLLRESARLARLRGDRDREISSLLFLVGSVDSRGGLEEVDILHGRILALSAYADVSMRNRAFAFYSIGGLMRFRGELDEAEPILESALELALQMGLIVQSIDIRLEIARLWLQQGRIADARRELEPLTWETTRPNISTGKVLIAWGEILLREDTPAHAVVALRAALAHGQDGRWPHLEADALELLALATADLSCLEAATVLDDSLGRSVRRDAIRSELSAQQGAAVEARAALDRACREAERLSLGPQSEHALWLSRAERAVALVERSVRSGGFGAAR